LTDWPSSMCHYLSEYKAQGIRSNTAFIPKFAR
jgi:hypothetical protein